MFGRNSTFSSTIRSEISCFNFTLSDDRIKEGLEVLTLVVNSSDPGVILGRDAALVVIAPNGGRYP